MKENTPDQIRRETVPVKHNGLVYGLLGGFAGTLFWFGGWALFHQEQVRRYPEYCAHAYVNTAGLAIFGKPPKHPPGMTAEELRYALLRHGNEDHRYDPEIIRHGWYPRGASPAVWVAYRGGVKAVYSDDASMVFKWPFTLAIFTLVGATTWGLIEDYRYRSSIIAGLPFDGSIVTDVDAYNAETKGEGMRYRVKEWVDR